MPRAIRTSRSSSSPSSSLPRNWTEERRDMSVSRRQFLNWIPAGAAISLASTTAIAATPIARVVVIGAGFAGATAAKYIRMWSPDIEVILVERDPEFISCPLSNRVLAGVVQLKELTRG